MQLREITMLEPLDSRLTVDLMGFAANFVFPDAKPFCNLESLLRLQSLAGLVNQRVVLFHLDSVWFVLLSFRDEVNLSHQVVCTLM